MINCENKFLYNNNLYKYNETDCINCDKESVSVTGFFTDTNGINRSNIQTETLIKAGFKRFEIKNFLNLRKLFEKNLEAYLEEIDFADKEFYEHLISKINPCNYDMTPYEESVKTNPGAANPLEELMDTIIGDSNYAKIVFLSSYYYVKATSINIGFAKHIFTVILEEKGEKIINCNGLPITESLEESLSYLNLTQVGALSKILFNDVLSFTENSEDDNNNSLINYKGPGSIYYKIEGEEESSSIQSPLTDGDMINLPWGYNLMFTSIYDLNKSNRRPFISIQSPCSGVEIISGSGVLITGVSTKVPCEDIDFRLERINKNRETPFDKESECWKYYLP
jgi:hypothetical protein